MESIEFHAKVEKFDSSLWGFHLVIELEFAQIIKQHKWNRIVCTINQQIDIHSALLQMHGNYVVLLNQQIVKKLTLQENQVVPISISKETATYGMPMAEEMEVVFYQDETAFNHFNNL